MDREYLEDYEQKEFEEYDRLVKERIQAGTFDFEKDRYPPDRRFINLQKPVALASARLSGSELWTQIPFTGSLVLTLYPYSRDEFEKQYFKISAIPKIVDFIEETGKLQVVLSARPIMFEGLNHFDTFFKELKPPALYNCPIFIFGDQGKVKKLTDKFHTLVKIRYMNFISQYVSSQILSDVMRRNLDTYLTLSLGRYTIGEDIENLIVDDPEKALLLLTISQLFVVSSIRGLCHDMRNFTLEQTKATRILPFVYQPREIQFPCEIGKFLLRKLTYAPQGLRACYDIIDHYKDYDLQKVQKSLNEAIVTNHPDITTKSANELYEILDNVWKDRTIPKRIENIRVGVPISIAALGGVAGTIVGGLIGGPEGAVIGGTSGVGIGDFLTKLGFKVGEKAVEKFFSVKGEQVSEKIAKLKTKSYQVNIYDFKKKYTHKIVK